MTNTYDVGDLVRVSAVFANSAGTAIDPTVVTLQVKVPAGTTTTYTYLTDVALVKDSPGHYHVDVNVTASGEWWYRWASTGTGQAAEESAFTVRMEQVP